MKIKYTTSTHKHQRNLSNLVSSTNPTEKPILDHLKPITIDSSDGDGVVSGNPPPHLETYEEFVERHKVDVHPIEIERLWQVVLKNRQK